MAMKTGKKVITGDVAKLLSAGKPKKPKGVEGDYAAKQTPAKSVMATDE